MIEGNKPSVYSKYVNPDPFNLNNRDIEGSQAGTLNRMNKFCSEDYNLRVDDIETKKKTFISKMKNKDTKVNIKKMNTDTEEEGSKGVFKSMHINNLNQKNPNYFKDLTQGQNPNIKKDHIRPIMEPGKHDYTKISYPLASKIETPDRGSPFRFNSEEYKGHINLEK